MLRHTLADSVFPIILRIRKWGTINGKGGTPGLMVIKFHKVGILRLKGMPPPKKKILKPDLCAEAWKYNFLFTCGPEIPGLWWEICFDISFNHDVSNYNFFMQLQKLEVQT